MKTKILYVLVSSDQDIYLEQAWVSIFSLRHFNANAVVSVVCDNRTAKRINTSVPQDFKRLVNDIVEIPFEESVSNRERSRWLKTNLRNLVSGDFLFLDTDTIITGSLDEIDSFDYDLGMVYSWHCKMSVRPGHEHTIKRIKKLFGITIDQDTDYYNSGVIYCKDTDKTHLFFRRWHEYWKMGKDKPKGIQDQQSLAVTVNELGGVYSMPGDYNCQPIYSMKYLVTAKIVHFFNIKMDNYIRSPFNSDDFYRRIRESGELTEDNKQLILSCRSTFIDSSMCICGDDIMIWRSPTFQLLRKLYRNGNYLFRVLNFISKKVGGIRTETF